MSTVPSIDLQACGACGRRWQTRFAGCPYCGAPDVHLVRGAGRGSVYSWVVVERSLEDPPAPTPYTIVAVDLDDGGRVLGRWAPGGEPAAGQRVTAAAGSWSEATPDLDARAFEPETPTGGAAR